MSRFIVVAPGSSEAAALATEELARVLGAATSVDALAGTSACDAALRPASALPAAVEAVRASGDDALIIPAREASNRSFDHVAWNLALAASARAGVVLAFDSEGASPELLAEEIAAARLRAQAAAASVVAVILTGAVPEVTCDLPIFSLPLTEETAQCLRERPAPTAVTPIAFQADLIERARADRKRIVLPEPDVSTDDPAYLERYAEEFARLRAKKGVTLEQAREKVTDVSYFGTMMVHMGDADGMVSGAAHTTAHTIVPSFQIIKTAPGVSVVSSIFLMAMKDRVWAFGDCAVNPNPTPEQLADIAVTSARTAAQFGVTPRVAMLSYSTGTSGSGPDVDAVVEATRLAREKAPDLAIEGPIQFDAAVDEAVASKKLPGSEVAGKATVFVFPSLEAGNIGYKAVQRSSGAVAVGPVLQGLNKPVNDLSRGALVEDIVNTVALTAVQAQG